MRLFVEHEPQILRAIMVLVPQVADARDILQDSAVTLWQHFSSYDEARPFVNWALGYARNHVRRYFRSVTRRGKLSDKAAEALLIASAGQDEQAHLRAEALAVCMQSVPEPARSILEGYYFHQRDVLELSRLYAKSAEAIYKIIQRMRQNLLECINSQIAASREAGRLFPPP